MPAEWAAGVIDGVSRWARRQPVARERLEPPWRCLGTAGPGPGLDGHLLLDVAHHHGLGATLAEVQLSGEHGPDHDPAFAVDELWLADGVLVLRPPAALPAELRTVWTRRAPLLTPLDALLAGLLSTGPAPLAQMLARRQVSGEPDGSIPVPAGLTDEQAAAYRACLEPGLRLVWTPPGSGRTRVLAHAVADLVRAGRRVLLVSPSAAAVDDALAAALAELDPRPGVVVRVGPAHLESVAAHSGVALSLLAAGSASDVDRRRDAVAAQLGALARPEAEVARLTAELAGFDADAYRGAAGRVRAHQELAELAPRTRAAAVALRRAVAARDGARAELAAATAMVTAAAPARAALDRADRLADELRRIDRELRRGRSELAAAATAADRGDGWWDRRRRRARLRTASAAVARDADRVRPQRADVRWQLMQATAAARHATRSGLAELDRTRATSTAAVAAAEAGVARAAEYAADLAELTGRATTRGLPDGADHELVAAADRAGHPHRHRQLRTARRRQAVVGAERARLAAELRSLTRRATALRTGAETPIVNRARVVASTLVGARLHPAVAGGRFDVVLVDQAAAAPLAETLLALTQAETTAVAFGDPMAMGPDLGLPDPAGDDPAIATWIAGTCFSHTGIRTAADALDTEGCVPLSHAFRLGEPLLRLAVAAGYVGLSTAPDDAVELVLVDGADGDADVGAAEGAVFDVVERAVADGSVAVACPSAGRVARVRAAAGERGLLGRVAVDTVAGLQSRRFDTVVLDLTPDGGGDDRGGDRPEPDLRSMVGALTRARTRAVVLVDVAAVRSADAGALAALRAALDPVDATLGR